MSTTGNPDPAPNGPSLVWSFGSAIGGYWSKKRVTKDDKIKTSDVNQLREMLETLFEHTHSYTDNASTSTTTTTTW
ncbi:MAG: hypothetical protein DRQ78_07495 [Epsilonproteobacteria bacterium]|nr:MAG: hypothetical protein DRQ78_07495 [Campylobacterota bacterium]